MKLIRLKGKDGRAIVGINHDGRVEQVFEAEAVHGDLAQRIVDAHNACEGIADGTLSIMAEGGGEVGTLPERIVAWSLFVGRARASASRIIEDARKIITKNGGKL